MLLVLILPILEDRVEILHATRGQKSDTVEETGDAPGSESASGEANEIYLVADIVIRCQESVGLADVFRDAGSRASANEMIPESTFGPNAGLVVDDLLGPIAVVWKESTAYTSDVGGCLQGTISVPRQIRLSDEAVIAVLGLLALNDSAFVPSTIARKGRMYHPSAITSDDEFFSHLMLSLSIHRMVHALFVGTRLLENNTLLNESG